MTTHTPLRCAYSGMAALSGTIVLLNTGNYPSFSSYGNETWVWNGATNEDWQLVSPSFIDPHGPLGPNVPAGVVMSARSEPVVAFDGTNVMVFGGKGGSNTAGTFQDTWLYNGTSWALQSSLTTIPQSRYGAQGALLDGYGALMFGGENAGVLLQETWVWSGSAWSQVSVANGVGPAARTNHAMAGNTTAATVVMFGGQGTNSQFNDTWSFNGVSDTWTKLAPATSPSVRSGHCMAYDSVNNLYVLFGGHNEYNYLPETWTFNGTTWSQVSVANGTGPAGRVGAQMAFDSANGLTIMYGGISGGVNYPDNSTWAFNGATLTWTKL